MWTVAQLSRDLATGKSTSRALVEQALARIADPAGEGARAYLKVYADQARAEAEHSDPRVLAAAAAVEEVLQARG